MSLVGFARVSTREQDLNIQLEALREAGCDEIFFGKHSGASKENDSKLAELVRYIRKDDVVIVTKLDRLGRSLKSVLRIIDEIHAKEATLKSLDSAIDTSSSSPISRAIISLIGVFAELERDIIVSRTKEGREHAMKNGVKFGRPSRLNPDEKDKVKKSYAKGMTMETLAQKYGVTRQTISNILKENASD
jgi:DNA invertase Pin-like site-specific DNA recombinase